MLTINTLLAFRSVAQGRFARVLDRAIKDSMAGKEMTPKMHEDVLRLASKNQHFGALDFANRVSGLEGRK